MSEYMEYAIGVNNAKRDLDQLSASQTTVNQQQSVTAFRELILSRPDVGFIRTDAPFILRFLRARQFDVDDSFSVYVNYYRFMHHHRNFFVGFNVNNAEVRQALEDGLPGVLPQRDSRGRRIMVLFASQWDVSRYSLFNIHRAIYLTLEFLLEDVTVQERGIVLIVDWSGFTFARFRQIQPAALRTLVDGLEFGFPIRFKAVHIVGQPWYVETSLHLLKPFLRESSRDKIWFHGHNLSSLHEKIPREILPAELGGEKPPYRADDWIQQMLSASSGSSNAPDCATSCNEGHGS